MNFYGFFREIFLVMNERKSESFGVELNKLLRREAHGFGFEEKKWEKYQKNVKNYDGLD